MIIKRPYAFFIKNFKKIHIVLLLLGLVVLFHQSRVYGFVKEFLDLQTYDPHNFPITKYIPAYLLLLVLIMAVGCLIITIVLKRKSKPWKLYLIPTIAYFLLLFMYIIIRGYFKTYTGAETTAEMSLYRDILLFASIAQYPSFAIFLVRIFGLDLRKFNFKSDTEYLELEEEDQEEIEININVDKESFRRGFYRLIRNLKYIYLEHKKTCLFIVAIISVILLRELYILVFVNNKSYKQNQEYNVNGYTFVVKDAYYTDKNFNGSVISKKNSFVIVNVNVRNNASMRELDTENFHLLNGVSNYTDTSQTYATEFSDMGKLYDNKEIGQGESLDIILVFRVDKELDKDRFVLVYQESQGTLHLRKIKLNMTDLSNVKGNNLEYGDSMKVKLDNINENISVDHYYVDDSITFKYRQCTVDECENLVDEFTAPQGKKILVIEYGTEEIDSKDIIDFSTNYGKIIYIDSKDKKVVVPMKNALPRINKGKVFYTLVPNELEDAKKVYLEYTIRNKRYVYGG